MGLESLPSSRRARPCPRSTQGNSSESMLGIDPVQRPLSRRSLVFAAALAFCLIPASLRAHSQDAAEAAHQKKTRKAAAVEEKAEKEKKDRHVYTNDDLKHSKILTPDDQARVEARKKEQSNPAGQPADALDAAAPKSPESLGEVARRYRRQKAAREAEQALKTAPHMSLPTELSQPAFAAPRPLSVPVKPTPPSFASSRGRRDPFTRPALVAPSVSALSDTSPRTTLPAPTLPAVVAPHLPSVDVSHSPAPVPRAVGPSGRSQPIPGSARVTIARGDSLWKLARQHLGSGSRWRDWLAVNPALPAPNLIQPGTVLVVPSSGTPSPQPKQLLRITVHQGESLWKIAKAELGSGANWLCIAHSNPQLRDPNLILPGQVLLLPNSCPLAP